MLSSWRTYVSPLALAVIMVVAPACTSDNAPNPAASVTSSPSRSSGLSYPTNQPSGTTSPARTTAPADPNTIYSTGLPDLAIGATLSDLVAAGVLTTGGGVCGIARDPDRPYVSPVFHNDRLVLIWAHPPLHTPEHIQVGTSVTEARAAYPQAVEWARPAGSEQFAGLLIPGDNDSAYLLLHDGTTVQKLVVGAEHYLRLLFDTRFGTC